MPAPVMRKIQTHTKETQKEESKKRTRGGDVLTTAREGIGQVAPMFSQMSKKGDGTSAAEVSTEPQMRAHLATSESTVLQKCLKMFVRARQTGDLLDRLLDFVSGSQSGSSPSFRPSGRMVLLVSVTSLSFAAEASHPPGWAAREQTTQTQGTPTAAAHYYVTLRGSGVPLATSIQDPLHINDHQSSLSVGVASCSLQLLAGHLCRSRC
eukprot:3736761-Amphidinium_carterae.1